MADGIPLQIRFHELHADFQHERAVAVDATPFDPRLIDRWIVQFVHAMHNTGVKCAERSGIQKSDASHPPHDDQDSVMMVM